MFSEALSWKLRRIAAGMRQQDVARLTGLSTSRLSGTERREIKPSQLERQLLEKTLPPFPAKATAKEESGNLANCALSG
jgi:transcriptional regulator with XRE-family HTH domain